MKKRSVILLGSLIFAISIFGNPIQSYATEAETSANIEIDKSFFDDMKCIEDEFEGTACYYPIIEGLNYYCVQSADYSYSTGGLLNHKTHNETTYYLDTPGVEEGFTAFPVIQYDEAATTRCKLECVVRYEYQENGVWATFPFEEAVILTDNKKYTIKNCIETTPLKVFDEAAVIINLGEKGINMIRDICEQDNSEIKIRLVDEFAGKVENKDLIIDTDVFQFVLEVADKYEAAGGLQQNLSAYDNNITIETR